MSKVMLINVSHEEESRVAIVEGGVLESLEIESIARTLKGNIYKGVVSNVNAALEAAFVSYGDERAAFLPLDEVNFKVLPTLPGREGHRGRGRIGDHLQPGREVLVQVVRDAFNSKPPTLSTFYSLPGRYLVLTPKSDGQGISRKIEDASQRDRLKRIVEELDPPEGFGVIVRTAGMDQSKTELQRDLKYLLRLWESIEGAASSHRAPALIYQERDVVLRTIRDHFTPDIEEVLIDDQEVYDQARRFAQAVMPAKEKAFKLYTGDKPLFSKYNLEDQIESIFRREVSLKSGGAIVIDEAEALTAIDVNSARSAREGSIEEMALRTNVEAAEEVARQLRLRDLGGLIVVDFIDLYHDKNTRQVEKTMRDAMKRDKAKYDVTRISKFGLMEISRQRIKVAKASAAYTPCARCEGTGVVKTTEAASLSIFRRIQARVVKGDLGTLRATVPEEAAVYLLNHKRAEVAALERRYDTRIVIVPHATMNPNRAEIETLARETPREAPSDRTAPRPLIADEVSFTADPADEAEAEAPDAADAPEAVEAPPAAASGTETAPEAVEEIPEAAASAEDGTADQPGRKRRRRRRRSRHGEAAKGGEGAGETSPAEGSGEPAEQAAEEPPALAAPAAVPARMPETDRDAGEDAVFDQPADVDLEGVETLFEPAEVPPPPAPSFPADEDAGFDAEAPERSRSTPAGSGWPNAPESDLPSVQAMAEPAEPAPSEEHEDDEEAGAESEPELTAAEAANGDPALPGATPHRKRRRRRRRSRHGTGTAAPSPPAAGEPARPGAAASAATGSREASRSAEPEPAPAAQPRPQPDPLGLDEDIPGGWWQKMRGGPKGGRSRDQD